MSTMAGMSTRFKAVDRETPYLLPPSVQDWLPEQHLARFVVEVVSKLDLHELKMPYTGVGSEAFNPEMLLALLFYGYATGVFASRKLEQATYDSIAFRYIAANTHPDHDTIATFRKRFLEQLKPLFLQILLLAKTMGFLKLGKISLDGSKVQATCSAQDFSSPKTGAATSCNNRCICRDLRRFPHDDERTQPRSFSDPIRAAAVIYQVVKAGLLRHWVILGR